MRFSSELNTQAPYAVTLFRENKLDCTPDDSEPNNTVGQATTAPTEIANLSICGSDPDWFAIAGTEGKRLVVRTVFLHADGDLDLMIVGLDGVQILAASDSVENFEEAEALLPLTGTYYIRVFSLSDCAAVRYSLEVEFTN